MPGPARERWPPKPTLVTSPARPSAWGRILAAPSHPGGVRDRSPQSVLRPRSKTRATNPVESPPARATAGGQPFDSLPRHPMAGPPRGGGFQASGWRASRGSPGELLRCLKSPEIPARHVAHELFPGARKKGAAASSTPSQPSQRGRASQVFRGGDSAFRGPLGRGRTKGADTEAAMLFQEPGRAGASASSPGARSPQNPRQGGWLHVALPRLTRWRSCCSLEPRSFPRIS
jgi:hypothetical protein